MYPWEAQLLRILSERGRVSEAELGAYVKPTDRDATLDPASMRWGPQLAQLLTAGKVTERELLEIENKQIDSSAKDAQDPRSMGSAATQLGSIKTNSQPNPSGSEEARTETERYEIFARVGRGGMGAVYRAKDRRLGRIVALKFIRGGDSSLRQRFEQEARAQARVEHPNICKIYEVGEVRDQLYIAMQFIDGLPLDKTAAQMSLPEKVQLIRDTASALHVAHEHGIIHRDIKPSNIMVERVTDENGVPCLRPVVMDFGLARESGNGKGMTQSGDVLGTPSYMSPEQARGEVRSLDRRTDVYSLGATLYDLLAGIPPFDDETVFNLILKVINEDPIPLRRRDATIPQALEIIVTKCLSKEPEQRYPTAKALAEDLGRYLSAQRIVGQRASLWYRVRYRAQRNKALFTLGIALLACVLGGSIYAARTRLQQQHQAALARTQAERQAALAQHLGQEIKDMEWLLRSARQLPLHDLEREKLIIRQRMSRLQLELATYGALGRGFAHYALGRGHLALHEYPQALVELELSVQDGNQSADVHYAMGIALGKHFEQAMYEARLSGGGDWAHKQLKAIEPKYLYPAVAALKQSRLKNLEGANYLEAMLAYYQRDYDGALNRADAALRESPWLYEAPKLAGDIHLERALQARDSGRNEDAEREFAAAVRSFGEAAEVGRSDGEVYEGLAETWLRQIEMAVNRGQPTEAAFAAATAASDKLISAEPLSVAGPLKKAQATLMTMGIAYAGMSSADRVQQCLAYANSALQKQPGNPYASDVAACCYVLSAENMIANSQDPEPLLRNALNLLETSVLQYPKFLWGLNDLALVYSEFGAFLRMRDEAASRQAFEKALYYQAKAVALDGSYLVALQNALNVWQILIYMTKTENEVLGFLKQADEYFNKCMAINNQWQQCYNNYFQVYARAAFRISLAGKDPQTYLARALENLSVMRKLGGKFLDTEQHDALARLVDARSRLHRNEDPSPALKDMDAALARCFALAAQDAMCRTLAAQADWVSADWDALHSRPTLPILKRALLKADLATKSPESFPDAWQVLAETHLRLALAESRTPAAGDPNISAGLAASEKLFALSSNHALGRATKGALELVRAQALREPEARRASIQAAISDLEKALSGDPFLTKDYAPLLAKAKAWGTSP